MGTILAPRSSHTDRHQYGSARYLCGSVFCFHRCDLRNIRSGHLPTFKKPLCDDNRGVVDCSCSSLCPHWFYPDNDRLVIKQRFFEGECNSRFVSIDRLSGRYVSLDLHDASGPLGDRGAVCSSMVQASALSQESPGVIVCPIPVKPLNSGDIETALSWSRCASLLCLRFWMCFFIPAPLGRIRVRFYEAWSLAVLQFSGACSMLGCMV